ncbi:helix-turn-helix transcriptional regulator [Cohaesibacter sp. CAU 1516]|uniref:ArsR/SmtB family transcription factor n=1 Tax=Cohaesibacter sp. CAU 1516 TaxID=2576038 RepID=UPI0010FF2621|nr:helix-turn-helix domain-containing protein [Cohaesibacter sp. CAU 1516]TLP49131.1 helix-turn-helix transcriptional regulator [Cohaesibacter sp. CAU 1516]
MKQEQAALGFAAIGSEARQVVLRCLVRAGSEGLSVGTIQERTGIAPSTLAHHLKCLAAAEVILQEKHGRSIVNRANFDHLKLLSTYILDECCADESP